MSVPCHFSSLSPPSFRFYRGDNYSDAGGYVADKLRERTGANVIVENRSGASGALAIDALRKAPADGTVLMYGTSATTVALTVTRKSPGFDLEKDLTPIALTGATATAFVVSSTLGVRTLGEYVAWVKKNPGKAAFGTTAPGSNTHFFGVLLGQAIGVPLEAVAYKGAAPLLGDLYGGHVPARLRRRHRFPGAAPG